MADRDRSSDPGESESLRATAGSRSASKRPVRGGRAGIRSTLFLVAEIVRRYDPDFAEFHRRLNAAGKPKKITCVAIAHKLLTRLNAKPNFARF